MSKKEQNQFDDVEEIRKILAESGEDIDPVTVARYYMPQHKTSWIASAFASMNKVKWLALILAAIVIAVFLIGLFQDRSGYFTINLNSSELYGKGINIDSDRNFSSPTARLDAVNISNASNITETDIAANVDEVDGSHNGNHYLAYTYYLRNAGKDTVDYVAKIALNSASKGAEKAARVAVWHNGKKTVYAAPASNGGAESGTVAFADDNLACQIDVKDFKPGYVDKYTVVIWLEGNDPECTDNIIGGAMQFQMDIDTADSENVSVIAGFWDDLRNTLFGDGSIAAFSSGTSGSESAQKITWDTRKNQ